MTTGQVILLLAVLLALLVGGVRLVTDGRFGGTHRIRGGEADTETEPVSVLHGEDIEHELGGHATLVQFSSAFCAPCRATRHVLADVAAGLEGVTHVEIDAEHHLALVRRLGITRTPTTLVLDATGREVTRAQGAPTRQQVLAALTLI